MGTAVHLSRCDAARCHTCRFHGCIPNHRANQTAGSGPRVRERAAGRGRGGAPGRAERSRLADGRQAFWVDGKKVGDLSRIEWRTTGDLKINAFWLMSYITDRWTKHKINRVGFDDVVVATEYVGPIAPPGR